MFIFILAVMLSIGFLELLSLKWVGDFLAWAVIGLVAFSVGVLWIGWITNRDHTQEAAFVAPATDVEVRRAELIKLPSPSPRPSPNPVREFRVNSHQRII